MARLDGPTVRITWHDAHSLDNNEWHEASDLGDDPLIVVSVGMLVRAKRHAILIQTHTQDGGMDNVLYIPWGMVRKIEKLQIPHKRRKRR